MRIRNRQSVITTGDEGVPPKKTAPSITRLLYFGFLIFIISYLIYTLGMRHFSYEGRGYIEIDTLAISTPLAGRVIQLPINAGQQIKAGDLIAIIESSKVCTKKIDNRGDDLEFEIHLNRAKLKSLNEELAFKTQQIDDRVIRRALEIDKEYNRARDLAKRDIEKLKHHIIRLTREIDAQKNNYFRHKVKRAKQESSSVCEDKQIFSPISGRIHQLHINLYEVAARNGAIATLVSNDATVYIHAAFHKDELRQLMAKPVLEIILPDGSISSGKVVSTHSVTKTSKIPGAKEGEVIAKIIPTSDEAYAQWSEFEQLQVKVKGSTL